MSPMGHNRTKAGVLREVRYVLADITTLTRVTPAPAQVRPPIVARSRFDTEAGELHSLAPSSMGEVTRSFLTLVSNLKAEHNCLQCG